MFECIRSAVSVVLTVLVLLHAHTHTHRQNAELVKLRQDIVRLSRELSERTDAQHAEGECRKALESKMAATEEQLAQVKVSE